MSYAVPMKDLRALEVDSLATIVAINEFSRIPELYGQAHAANQRLRNERGNVDVHLGFSLDTKLRGDRNVVSRRFDVGALIVASGAATQVDNCSYSVVICEGELPPASKVARKLHFDLEPHRLRQSAEPKPTSHLQVCGKLSSHHIGAGYRPQDIAKMLPHWEKPRVPSQPVSLALLLNWLFLEFGGDPLVSSILNHADWTALVRRAEQLVLKPYYEAAAEFIKKAAGKDLQFQRDFLYAT